MNDELTPDERAAMRARIVGGARGIRPEGAHRNAWIAGSIAAALVVAIAGGVAATSTLSAPQIATTPTPSATTEPTPSPTPTPTSTPTPSPTTVTPSVAFDGNCAAVLTEESVSSVVGVPMALSNGLPTYSASVLGGVSCQWVATGGEYQAVGVAVFPWAAVPETVRAEVGVVPDCIGGYTCDYAQRFDDAAVLVWASRAEELTALAAAVGDRAARSPGTALALPTGAWVVPECSDIRDSVARARGRGDIIDHRGDYYPRGFSWQVMSERGAAAYCAVDNLSAPEDTPTVVDFLFGPGASPDYDEIARRGGTPIAIEGADAAWYFPDFTASAALVLVQAGPNTLTVGTQNMTEDEMSQAAAAVIAALG